MRREVRLVSDSVNGEEKDLPSGGGRYVLTCCKMSDFVCSWNAEQRESVRVVGGVG